MMKIKSIKWNVELSYKNSFIFDSIGDAAAFMNTATRHPEELEDIALFRLVPYVEYEEEEEESDNEVIDNEDVHQD